MSENEKQKNSIPKSLTIVLLTALSIVSILALLEHGYWGIITHAFATFAGMQVLLDLVIALTLVLIWMWFDAKRNQRKFWPWALLTLTAGSFGPLFYLLCQKRTRLESDS